MKQITIIKIKPDQWKIYKEIRLQALQEHPVAFSDTYEKASMYGDDFWSSFVEDTNKILLFAFDAGKVVGSIGAYFDVCENKKTAILIGVYVSNAYQGKGIGKQLMSQLLAEIEKQDKVSQIKLWVAATQIPAIEMYKSFGFSFIGKEEKPIPFDGQLIDELIMQKNI